MKLKFLTLFSLILLGCGNMKAAGEVPQRPPIIGIAHAGFFTKDIDNTRDYLKNFLGYDETVTLQKDGKLSLSVFKVNERQYIEIFPEREKMTNRMYHFAVETTDAEAMRLYLKSKGCKVPDHTPKGRTGNLNFFVTDPNGTICEIVQYGKDGMMADKRGLDLSKNRISTHLSHVGFMVPDIDKALSFYRDILGFREVWRGGSNPEKVNWVHLSVPEGFETIELMLYDEKPTWERMGSMNHICLEVQDIYKTKAILDGRKRPDNTPAPTLPKTGINKKYQINYYLIDGTRIEIMEEQPFDGVLAPSSKGKLMKYTADGK
jgi:catechol 2,3-dioxygenase-like lactoylglutathione lyase family enzyme